MNHLAAGYHSALCEKTQRFIFMQYNKKAAEKVMLYYDMCISNNNNTAIETDKM
jgi:hypothetical protein